MVAQNMSRIYKMKWVFLGKNVGFDDTFDVSKCLSRIKMHDLLYVRALCSKLSSNISTLVIVGAGILHWLLSLIF